MSRSRKEGARRRVRMLALFAALATVALVLPSIASAHLERPSYWPQPGPDTSVTPPAGGGVPIARSLSSAVSGRGPGKVRVVCQKSSLTLAKRSIRRARKKGYRIRPSQPLRRLSRRQARRLELINRKLRRKCRFRSIQSAVNRSGNNDRIVILPGRYTEPKSRAAKTNDPKCNPSLLQDDQRGAPTPSYAYQATCPNDQNLIHVAGREIKGKPLSPPRGDRHGIPEQELGRCIRCNLQIEGTGVVPEDVIIDAGKDYKNPLDPQAKPGGHAKHVVMRTDRTDGFVGKNFLLRGALEHGFYTEETDGILLDKVKFFWNADYGHLSFTTDHNVIQNCDGMGAGDAVVYPGASPQTGEFRDKTFYPEQRFNTVVRRCDLRGSTLAYSGSMGNSVRITDNHIYGNANGIASDTLSAPGHPGFPADGVQVDNNYIYSNNLNLYRKDAPVTPLVPMPIGTGIVFPGMNGSRVFDNWIFDNWRHGVLLAAVPDAVAGEAEGNLDPGVHCSSTAVASTSCDNRFFRNKLGKVPPNFRWPTEIETFGNKTGDRNATVLPNGVDWWWDEFAGNNGNCWYDNELASGGRGPGTGPGAGAPPDILPSNCETSVGNGDVVKEATLLDCSMWQRGNGPDDHNLCYWFDMPPKPGSAAASAEQRSYARKAARFAASDEGRRLKRRLDEIAKRSAFANRHG